MLDNDQRPWGYWEEYLNESSYRLKRIVVYPGKRISLQKHLARAEHWVIVQGAGILTLNKKEMHVKVGSTVFIDIEDIHRIENNSTNDLIFIETQIGECLEKDIIRIEDDWNRK